MKNKKEVHFEQYRAIDALDPDIQKLIAENPSFLVGEEALRFYGITPHFADNLLRMLGSLGTMLTVRASKAGNKANERLGPKTGETKTKSTRRGFLKSLLSAAAELARVKEGAAVGLNKKDKKNMELSIFESDYQHSIQLKASIGDIAIELADDGSLEIVKVIGGKIFLQFKEGIPEREHFPHNFVYDLATAEEQIHSFSRPWDEPDWDKDGSALQKGIIKLEEQGISKLIIDTLKDSIVKVSKQKKGEEVSPVKVLANKPTNRELLLNALEKSWPDMYAALHQKVEEGLKVNTRQDILDFIKDKLQGDGASEEQAKAQMEAFYDKVCLAITGDQDFFDIAISREQKKDEFDQPINTFSEPKAKKQQKLREQTTKLFMKMVQEAYSTSLDERSDLQHLLIEIKENNKSHELKEEFFIERAGNITPREFLFNQLSNYAYRQAYGCAFHDMDVMKGMQEGFNRALELLEFGALKKINKLQEEIERLRKEILDGDTTKEAELQSKFRARQNLIDKVTREALEARTEKIEGEDEELKEKLESLKEKLEKHLAKHIRLYIQDPSYYGKEIRHPHHDFNLHNLLQHGCENRNPGPPHSVPPDLTGSFVTIIDGVIIGCDSQESLIALRLSDHIIEKNVFDVHFTADMRLGWGEIIARQLDNKQKPPDKTISSFKTYLEIMRLEEAVEKGLFSEMDAKSLAKIVSEFEIHNQFISEALQDKYKEYTSKVAPKEMVQASLSYSHNDKVDKYLRLHKRQQQAEVKHIERVNTCRNIIPPSVRGQLQLQPTVSKHKAAQK